MVFRFFTEPALLKRWLCIQAEVDARPGGGYAFNVTGRPHNPRNLPGPGAGAPAGLHVAVRSRRAAAADHAGGKTLTPLGRGTRVRLRHHGFVDQPTRDRHAAGWAHYLPRLVVAAAGREPGADEWRTALLPPTEE